MTTNQTSYSTNNNSDNTVQTIPSAPKEFRRRSRTHADDLQQDIAIRCNPLD